MDDATARLPDALASALREPLGDGVRIEGLRRLTGGASRETWAFDAAAADGTTHPLILRRDFVEQGRPSLASLIGVDDTALRTHLRETVRARLAVSNPKYLSR